SFKPAATRSLECKAIAQKPSRSSSPRCGNTETRGAFHSRSIAMASASGNHREPDIHIVGLGVKGIEHVTRETESACRRSNEILAVANLPAVLTYLKSLCLRVTDLHPLSYEEDENRLKAYDTMSAMVLAAALDHAPVTFATYGHPLIYVYPTRQIVDAAPYLGLTVRVLAGISSLDTMLIDLGVDPAIDGLQMYEATD